jgi:hypothetical protein
MPLGAIDGGTESAVDVSFWRPLALFREVKASREVPGEREGIGNARSVSEEKRKYCHQ